MTTEAAAAPGADAAKAAEAGAPSNTRVLGAEVESYALPGTASADLGLPGKEVPAADEQVTKPEAKTDAAAAETPKEEPKAEAKEETGEEKKEGDEPAEGADDKLDIAAYQKEFDESGKLSDDTYSKIEKLTGFDRDTIDSIASAMKAQQDANTARWSDMMGGQENQSDILSWARENYSPAQLAAYNKAIDSKDVAQIDLAVKGLVSDYKEAGGSFKANTTVTSGDAPNFGASGGAEGYNSQDEYRQAVRDPRYKRDPVFRGEVQRKLRASEFFKKSRSG